MKATYKSILRTPLRSSSYATWRSRTCAVDLAACQARVYDPENLHLSGVDVVIDAHSISAQEIDRDAQLKSADCLDVEEYPTIALQSKSIAADGEGELRLKGDLSVHGVIKEVVLKAEGPSVEAKDPTGT